MAAPRRRRIPSIRDARGDAPPRWDMTQVKLTNSGQIAGRAVAVNLRPGAGYFAVRFGQPGNPDDLFTASTGFARTAPCTTSCTSSASWSTTTSLATSVPRGTSPPNAVRVLFPRSCLQGLHGPLNMQAGLGPLPRFHSQDHSRWVRVLQR